MVDFYIDYLSFFGLVSLKSYLRFINYFVFILYIQSMDTSIRDFQYGGVGLQYMLIMFLVITLKRQFG